jgi:REP element-mobilizing transposase RayT
MNPPRDEPGRHKPASGVHIDLGQPTIVFVTVDAEHRAAWIAQPNVHQLLLEVWREAQAWLVGYYLLMPDHLPLFAAPHNLDIPLNRWMTYWKRLFTQKAANAQWRWQSLHWDTRLRRSESYADKWGYIRENPMRKGLVTKPEDWPYQGMMNILRW